MKFLRDIPGLIKGAHEGTGLGDRFLRHIERSSALIFVVDMAGGDGRDPLEDYKVVQAELSKYQGELLRRPSLVVANKMDLPEAEEHLAVFKRKTGLMPLEVSAETGAGLDELKKAIRQIARWET